MLYDRPDDLRIHLQAVREMLASAANGTNQEIERMNRYLVGLDHRLQALETLLDAGVTSRAAARPPEGSAGPSAL